MTIGESLEPLDPAAAAVAQAWQWEPGNALLQGRANTYLSSINNWHICNYCYCVFELKHDNITNIIKESFKIMFDHLFHFFCRTDGGHNCKGSSKSFTTCNRHVIILLMRFKNMCTKRKWIKVLFISYVSCHVGMPSQLEGFQGGAVLPVWQNGLSWKTLHVVALLWRYMYSLCNHITLF